MAFFADIFTWYQKKSESERKTFYIISNFSLPAIYSANQARIGPSVAAKRNRMMLREDLCLAVFAEV